MDPLTTQPSSSPPVDHEGKWVLIAVIGLGALFLYWLDPGRWLRLDVVQAQREALLAWTAAHEGLAAAAFILLYCLQTALSFPGATLLTLLGGFLFGPVLGALYVNVGATTGATLAFLSARYLFRDTVERKFGARLQTIQEGFARDGFNYLL
ncbi:MAG: VTT domain-containing protein, partial [Nitrospiria bacterium]